MTDTFTWRVHITASGKSTFDLSKVQMGDGYEQSVVNGINPEKQEWGVTVSGRTNDIKAIRDFIVAHAGMAFFWTPPLGVQGYYKCDGYEPHDQGGGYWTLNMTFYQSYQP